jgi:alpha-glucosidase
VVSRTKFISTAYAHQLGHKHRAILTKFNRRWNTIQAEIYPFCGHLSSPCLPAATPHLSRYTASSPPTDQSLHNAMSKSSEQHQAQPSPWWRQGVLYQIYPRSFQDESGDGVGDLQGITRRLDYVKSLGVSAIWISPFFLSPMKDFGYDVEDHRAIDPLFGSLEDFDKLIAEAHHRGIRVLIDLVLSHTSDRHPWFSDARQDKRSELSDCYVWADPSEDGGPPNNWLSVFGGPAWTFESRRNQYYLHNFLATQPDLNFHSPRVRQEALDIARWWLERGVDGFRLDTVNFYFHDQALRDNPRAECPDDQVVPSQNPYSELDHRFDKNQPQVSGFLDELRALLDEFPQTIALGEIGAAKGRALDLMREYQAPGRLHLSYAFDLLSSKFSARHFRDFIAENSGDADMVWRCLAFSNHDVRRTATRLDLKQAGTDATASIAMALLLCLRGTPCIYQGEELGLTEVDIPYEQLVDPYGITFWPEFKGRDGCRTPIPWEKEAPHAGFTPETQTPWLPIPGEHVAQSVDQQQHNALSQLQQTRALIKMHSEMPAFHSDNLDVLESPEDMLVLVRGRPPEAALCIFNISCEPHTFERPRGWEAAEVVMQHGEITTAAGSEKQTFKPWSWQVLASH